MRQNEITPIDIARVGREVAMHAEILVQENFDLGEHTCVIKDRIYEATKHAVVDTLETVREIQNPE